MKPLTLLLLLLIAGATAQAQYDKEKLTALLVANAWTVTANTNRPEKKMVFTRDQVVTVDRDNGKGGLTTTREKWSLASTDNIRWFLTVGGQTYELIVSYTKSGSQFLKLTRQLGNNSYSEINLYATK